MKQFKFANLNFQVFDEVYEPAEDSFLLADYLSNDIRSNDVILDLGTGTGIQAIIAATLKNDVNVIATDINPFAVRNAKKNALMNKISQRIEFIHGDLFQPLHEKEYFNLIIFNPPYLPLPLLDQKTQDWISLAWAQGIGSDIIHRFLLESHAYIKKNGRILMILSTLSNFDFKRWEGTYSIKRLSERAFFFEKIILVKITKVR